MRRARHLYLSQLQASTFSTHTYNAIHTHTHTHTYTYCNYLLALCTTLNFIPSISISLLVAPLIACINIYLYFVFHRRASSSFKHNTSFVARLPTIRRHKSQTIQAPGPDGSTLSKPPGSSRASTRYTRTIRDINASVENLGKLRPQSVLFFFFAKSFFFVLHSLTMAEFVFEDFAVNSCYEIIPIQ